MSRFTKHLLAVAATLAATACSDIAGTPENAFVLGSAFQTVPAGFSATSNSFDASGDAGEAFLPENMAGIGFHGGGKGGNAERGGRDGFGEGGTRGQLMGGGLGRDFMGLIAFGKGRGRGPFGWFKLPDSCTFSEATGRVTCPERTRHGLTVNASYAFKDSDGEAQPSFDTLTTNSVNVQIEVEGTKTRRDGAVTSTLAHASDRTISGLAPGSDERTVNGTAQATEITTGTRDDVEFTISREISDTTNNVVIPIVEGRPTIPNSGVVIRNMTVTIARDGEEARSRSRREKITFDGTNVIEIEITQDGVTKNCTLTLPSKKLVCE